MFEGPYRPVKDWHEKMQQIARAADKTPGYIWFFYTTCPKCAKTYGHNYVDGVVGI